MKKLLIILISVFLVSCGSANSTETTEINVFIAASLNNAMTELSENYMQKHTDTTINLNADSSGKLTSQILEGASCDIFFSAAESNMDTLEAEGLVKEDSRTNLLKNSLAVVTYKGSGTAVAGLENIGSAKSIALAGASVPAGAYARKALISLGMLPETEDISDIDTAEISEALGGVTVSEQDNVSKVVAAVAEGACEVGCVYLSDVNGFSDKVEIIQLVDKKLTGPITYPAALIENGEESQAAADFFDYLKSDEAKAVFEKYDFDTY